MPDLHVEVLEAVRRFSAFTTDNDPYGENDCASVAVRGETYIWKIDNFARRSGWALGSADPAVACVTERVITIMRGNEY